MTPERWQRVKSALAEILELPRDSRSAHMERLGGSDPELRAELESLLAANDAAAASGLETGGAAGELATGERLAGQRLGAYLVLEEIGTGGMGEVFRAVRDDNEYRQEVAIKLVRTAVRSPLIIQRFRQERQILAALSHPNIARLLDGGTTADGVAYLVMERIDGQEINEFCDARRLDTAARIGLFLQVCAAVQYAHEHLVVHRDIKPGNILVTADGVPKLLDFGIAKILESNAASSAAGLTVHALHLFTPEYASPDQLLDKPITAASDVYSLGVVLYQLLTGRSPYSVNDRSPHALARVICEVEPERPALGGDLDHILLKALRKEPQQRYPSVQSFADDLRACLTGRPVAARRGTLAYRAGKFVRRNELPLAATAVVLALIAVGVAAVLREARVARAERQLADDRFESLRKLTNSMLFEFHDAIENLPGSTKARELVVQRALEYLAQLDAGGHDNTELQRDLAAAYERIARIEGEDFRAHLGGPGAEQNATQLYEKALAIRRALAAAHPDDPDLQLELLATTINVSAMYWVTGELPRAVQTAQKGLQYAEVVAARQDSAELHYRIASLLTGIAVAKVWLGEYPAALDYAQRSLAIKEKLLAAAPDSARARRQVLISRDWMATALRFQRRFTEAAAAYREALVEADHLAAGDPNNIDLRRLVAGENESLCKTLAYAGEFAAVPEHCRRAIDTAAEMARADRNNVQALADLGSANLSATVAYYLMRLPRQAAAYAERADAIYQEVRAQDPSVANTIDHGMTLLFLGRIDAGSRRTSEGRSLMEHARELIRSTVERSPSNRYYRDSLAEAEDAIRALPLDTAAVGIH